LLGVLMKGTNYGDDGFIAGIHNSAKVWVTYTKYTILDSNEIGGILHLRYESDITTFL